MMLELVVCDVVGKMLSFYNAAEGDCWYREEKDRMRMQDAWWRCYAWLTAQGIAEEFKRRGGYLI